MFQSTIAFLNVLEIVIFEGKGLNLFLRQLSDFPWAAHYPHNLPSDLLVMVDTDRDEDVATPCGPGIRRLSEAISQGEKPC